MTHPIYWDPTDPAAEALFRPPYEAFHGGAVAIPEPHPPTLGGAPMNGDYFGPGGTGAGGSLSDVVLGGLGGLINWGIGGLPARRPPMLPPARTGGGGLPAGVPYPGTPPIISAGRAASKVPGIIRAAIKAGTAYVLGDWVYDAVTNTIIGRRPRRRRMNVLNPRALRRSMRRVEGFAHFAKRTITFSSRVKLKKRGRFGRRK